MLSCPEAVMDMMDNLVHDKGVMATGVLIRTDMSYHVCLEFSRDSFTVIDCLVKCDSVLSCLVLL